MDVDAVRIEEGAIFQRFEAKYRLNEMTAVAIRDYLTPFVIPDKHNINGKPYCINSLYLDSPDLRLYHSSADGEKNRFKIRIRSYPDDPSSPVFFEIKRRMNQVILKQRATVRRECVRDLVHGAGFQTSALDTPRMSEIRALLNFRDIMEAIQASPRCMVCYEREAYLSAFNDPVRISFDRNLTCFPAVEYSESLWVPEPIWQDVRSFEVLMEIKFNDAMPLWVQELIQRFELTRVSSAKYNACVNTLRQLGISLQNRREKILL